MTDQLLLDNSSGDKLLLDDSSSDELELEQTAAAGDSLLLDDSSGDILVLDNTSGDELLLEGSGSTPGTITIDSFNGLTTLADECAVIQRNAATGTIDITIQGSTTGDEGSIEYRILNEADSSEIRTWTSGGTSASGSFSFTMSAVPDSTVSNTAIWYEFQVRKADHTSVTAASNKIGVGFRMIWITQSNGFRMFDRGNAVTGSAFSSVMRSSDNGIKLNTANDGTNSGNGAAKLGELLVQFLEVPVMLIDSGEGGSSITEDANSSENWSDLDGTAEMYDRLTTTMGGLIGTECEAALYMIGRKDLTESVPASQFADEVEHLILNQIRTDWTNRSILTNLPIFRPGGGRSNDGQPYDADSELYRVAMQAMWADIDDAYVLANTIDLARTDDAGHFTEASFTTVGTRFAYGIDNVLGDGLYRRGPIITSYEVIDSTTIDTHMTHTTGTDFEPTSAIEGLRVEGATTTSHATGVRQSATVIRWTHNATGAIQQVDMSYATGYYIDDTKYPYDTGGTISLPVRKHTDIPLLSDGLFSPVGGGGLVGTGHLVGAGGLVS